MELTWIFLIQILKHTGDYGYQDLGLSIADTSASSNLGVGEFIYNVNIESSGPQTLSLLLEADSGYQEIDFGGITSSSLTTLNAEGEETTYDLEYTLQPSGSTITKSILLEGIQEITDVTISGNLDLIKNKYFELSSTNDDNKYYVWYRK